MYSVFKVQGDFKRNFWNWIGEVKFGRKNYAFREIKHTYDVLSRKDRSNILTDLICCVFFKLTEVYLSSVLLIVYLHAR